MYSLTKLSGDLHHIADNQYGELLSKYPEITQTDMGQVITLAKPLHIDTGDATPVASRCRPLYGEKKTAVEAELLKWEAEGIISRSDSEWASPIHSVKKPDGTWRVCGDFRRLNMVTKPDRYPVPSLTSFNKVSTGALYFQK